MAEIFTASMNIDLSILFSTQYLAIPGIIEHLDCVILSTAFYIAIYNVVGPLLYRVIKPKDFTNRDIKLAEYHWVDNLVSLTQSCINSAIAVYLLVHTEFRRTLTAEERYLGYHWETSRALAVMTGYFCYHLGLTWVSRDIHGWFMFLHGVSAILAVPLGFVSLFPN
jgi:hypothetical protein